MRPSTSRRKRVFSYVLPIKIENLNHVKFLKIVQILNFAHPFAKRRVSSFVRPTKYVCNDWNTKFYSLILIFFMNALICFLKPNLRLHFENSFLQIGEFLIRELRSKRGVSSDHADMNKISGKVFKFYLWNDWIHLKIAIENSVSSITAVETHSIKTMQFSLSIAVHTSGVAQKNQYWLVATQKTKIGEQFNLVSHSPIWWAIQQ